MNKPHFLKKVHSCFSVSSGSIYVPKYNVNTYTKVNKPKNKLNERDEEQTF